MKKTIAFVLSLLLTLLMLSAQALRPPLHAHAQEHEEPDQPVVSGEETTPPEQTEETAAADLAETLPAEPETSASRLL